MLPFLKTECKIPEPFWFKWSEQCPIMANSQCTGTELGQVQGTGPGAMDPNLLYWNVHAGLRQGKEPGSIVSCCAGPVPCTYPSPVPVQCEKVIRVSEHFGNTENQFWTKIGWSIKFVILSINLKFMLMKTLCSLNEQFLDFLTKVDAYSKWGY